MRHDILNIIKNATEVTNAVILTHNIDFVFVQSVVLPALRKCGSPALTIFADAHCSEQAYQHQARVLSTLGLRYRVVPVAMKTGFRFHPKAVLLTGTKKGTLVVGSGNLTYGGWRENAEVWLRYDTDTDGTGPFSAFRDYMRQVVELCVGPSEGITRETGEAFDPTSRAWAATMVPSSHLLGRAGHGESMLRQMKVALGDRTAEHLFVCAPYFDEEADALRTMARELGASSSTVLVQSNHTNLLVRAASDLGPTFELKAATFQHREQTETDGQERIREALLHAKLYAVQSGDEVVVFAGSANCSRAALTIPGADGNAELMTWTVLSKPEFESRFLNELVIGDLAPRLATEIDKLPETEPAEFIQIHSARLELGHIQVFFGCSEGVVIGSALVDEMPLSPVAHGENWITFHPTQPQPHTIVLVGLCDGREFKSLSHWIDNEAALRVSARGRSLAESIHQSVRHGTWGIGAWTEVLSELYKHLEYMPKAGFRPQFPGRRNGDHKKEPVEFEWTDVFSQGYQLPVGSALRSVPHSLEERIGGLRSMLLRWYGIAQPEPGDDIDLPDDDPLSAGGKGVNGGNETDRPAPLPKVAVRITQHLSTARELRRAVRLVQQVADRLADPDFIRERQPELLAADLKVAALLLRAGLADGWITQEEFFDATLQIWLPLFFNAERNEHTGWIEQRYRTAPSPEGFADAIRSADLAAALACWALSTPPNVSSPGHARFVLASVLSVARLPWLWQTGGNEEIAKQVADVFAYTSTDGSLDWNAIEHRWLKLIRRGYALNRLQKVIAGEKVADLAKRIAQRTVYAGELLWQGALGFCVANSDCSRVVKENCDVLLLQRGGARRPFAASLLIPIAGLLDERVVEDGILSRNARSEIAYMVRELRRGLHPRESGRSHTVAR